MRLIDADSLIKELQEQMKTATNPFFAMVCDKCIDYLEKQPTAYDVEKLIGRLEERKKIILSHKIVDAEDESMIFAYNEAINIVKELAEEYNNGWIPCSERLPDTGVTVLAYGKRYDQHDNKINYYYIFTHINEKGWWFDDFGLCDEIIAWQPLPPAYEEADK